MPEPISVPVIPWQTITLTNRLEKAKNALNPSELAHAAENDLRLKEACAEFESLFVFHLLKEMRAAIPKSDFMSGGKAEEIYTSLLDSHLAREIALKGGIGLSAILLDRLRRILDTVKVNTARNRLNN